MNFSRLAPAVLVIVTASALGCGGQARESATTNDAALQVGLVFDVGGRGDKSFNDAAYAGLVRAEHELGVHFTTLESGEGAEREAGLRQLAASGADLVFGVGFLFSDDIRRLAGEFPGTRFACIDYTLTPGEALPPNLAALVFKEEEGCFLVGALAALLTRTGTVGFVGGMETPLIRRFETGYRAGVFHAKRSVRVLAKYAGTTGTAFKDPTKGKELALSEYQQGADIIFHAAGSTGLGVFEAARQTGKLVIGVDSDQNNEAPGNVLTSMVKRVDRAVFEVIRETRDGRFPAGARVFGLAEGGVGWVYDGRNSALIPDSVKAAVDTLERRIIEGAIRVPREHA
jgi:basic membrane protein A